jgi:CBS domain-containing protein
MRVVDIMMGTPYYCRPEMNLGSATELMWRGDCGFLPVIGNDGKVVGVITDRDICVALGTRGRPSGDVTVAEAMSRKAYFCAPDDDVHIALRAMREGHVRRLPVFTKSGELVGVVSMDDMLSRAETPSLGKAPELSTEDVVKTFQAINVRQLPQPTAKQAAAA